MNFLNDSLKTLKTVLSEGLDTKDFSLDPNVSSSDLQQESTSVDSDNLKKIINSQSEEISILRQQIFEYQQSKLNEISSNSKSLITVESQQQQQANVQQQNDSWFWEPELSSTSSKKDSNGSPAEAEIDLTTIPLDSNDHELMDKLRRQVADKDTKLKAFNVENSILNEKLKHLSAENHELNLNIDELDKQHQLAIENVLDSKKGLQDKLNSVLDELKGFRELKNELVKSHKDSKDQLDIEISSLKSQLDEIGSQHQDITAIAKNYEKQVDELMNVNLKQETEIVELKDTIRTLQDNVPELVVNNDECLKKIINLINTSFKLNESYTNEDEFMGDFTKWITSTSSKFREMDFEMSKLIDENKLIREESTKHIHERDALKSELINYEIECSELMKNNNILMADIESLRHDGKLETIMENDGDDDEERPDDVIINQCPDDELHSIRLKLEATEVEKTEYVEQIQRLKHQLTDNVSRCKEYQQEIDNLENEKCNYLFELNELKSEEERNILQKELKLYKDKEVELAAKLAELEKDHDVLQKKYDALQNTVSNQIEDTQKDFDESNKLLNEKEVELKQALKELERLNALEHEVDAIQNVKNDLMEQLKSHQDMLITVQKEKQLLETNCDELKTIHESNLEGLIKSNDLVQELQKKILEADTGDDFNVKIASLEESLDSLTQEKENLIALVTTKHNENVQYHSEILRLNQAIQQHVEKQEVLSQNLQTEQNNYRLLLQEKNDAVEMNNTLNKDIERLRQHLLEVADAYTFEQVSLQKQVEEYKSKSMALESDAKKSATAYTSANIRANQQAETLQTQYNLLAQQRDELLVKLSTAEDIDSKNQAALTNLQVALEIFQRDKERDVELRTSTIKRELEAERFHQSKLNYDIQQLQQQLQEAKNGLMAATRLNDQLELNQLTIDRLNNEISSYRDTVQSLKKQLEDSNANTSNADIDLIKNLIIGYITAPANANNKLQILKLISNVLNLNENECSRIGLRPGGGSTGGWFSRSSDSVNNNVSLTEAFVAFLEKESQPRVNANLLTIHENESKSAVSRKSSIAGSVQEGTTESQPAPIHLEDNALLTPYCNRNSSTILKDLLHDT